MAKAIITYDDFKIFFNENSSKIYMTPESGSGKHPILKENIERWKQRVMGLKHYSEEEISTLKKFCELVERNLRYVTFDEFFGVIQRMAIEMLELIKEKNRVIFLLDDEPNKSNTWVSLLFFGELEKLGLEEYKSKLVCISPSYDRKIYTEIDNTVCFFFDDMIYSGTQSGGIAYMFSSMNGTNNFQGYMAVPFVSRFSFNNIVKNPVKFLGDVQVVDNLRINVDTDFKDEPETTKNIMTMCLMEGDARAYLKGDFNKDKWDNYQRSRMGMMCQGINNGQTLIYFDHKIADHVSVLMDVESHGQYPINMELEHYISNVQNRKRIIFPEAGSLIANCDETNREIYCYTTFYKTYKYTYKGKELISESSSAIEQMYTINSMAGGRKRKYTHKRRWNKKRKTPRRGNRY